APRSRSTAWPSRWSSGARRRLACAMPWRRAAPSMAARSSDDTDNGRLATLAVLALVVGAAAGLIGAVFRIVLEQADALRDRVIVWAHGEALWGFAAVVLAGAAAALVATWLVRRFAPHASGSGIPHVE